MLYFMKKFQTFSIIRLHVLQFNFTSYSKSINHRISIRSFLHSFNRCMILSRWKSLFENFKQRIVEEIISLRESHRWESYIVEKVCTKVSNSLEYWTEDTNDCCEEVLKVQFSQICSTNVAIKIQLYKSINWN